MNGFNTPILFIVFNRPGQTEMVLERIRKIRPLRLFVAADGPRNKITGEIEKCNSVRQLFSNIDWKCELETLYRDNNFGCKKSVSSAISWFFENVDEGIILEDDCLPDLSFFRFCEELLEFYRDNDKIMLISGGNFQFGNNRVGESYYFSRYAHVWGWATWKNRWQLYDVEMKLWKNISSNKFLSKIIENKNERKYWTEVFNKVYNNKIDTWDYQLLFASWINEKLSIIPNDNLICNIGFDCEATHTKNNSLFSRMETNPITFPLIHPRTLKTNVNADLYTSETQYRKNIIKKIKSFLKNKFKSKNPVIR